MPILPVSDRRPVAGTARIPSLPRPLTPAVIAFVVIGFVVIRTIAARLPGLNPESLWYDDLAWAAFARVGNVRSMLFGAPNASPGFLVVLWASSALFRDPEWSMQLVPFLCGLASIPVMAAMTWRMTKSHGLALLAAALTALNPMLAHYSVFVKTYSVDFLVTAVLLYAATPMLMEEEIRPADAVRLLLLASVGAVLSATSVFVSLPAINVVALRVWMRRRHGARAAIIWLAIAYDAILVLGALWFRLWHYSGGQAAFNLREDFYRRLSHPLWLWAFTKESMVTAFAPGLPTWSATQPWDPATLPWTLAFGAAGLVWLLARQSTRAIGLLLLVVLSGFTVAAYTNLYPLTNLRRGIFAFPLIITLAVMSIHAATAWWSRREALRMAAGLLVVAFALYAPVRVIYWGVNDERLIRRLSSDVRPSDALILSPAGTYLAAYYGPWRVNVPTERLPDGTGLSIVRNRTLQLPRLEHDRVDALQSFLRYPLQERVYYVAFRTAAEEVHHVLSVLNERGYGTEVIESTTRGKLYIGLR